MTGDRLGIPTSEPCFTVEVRANFCQSLATEAG